MKNIKMRKIKCSTTYLAISDFQNFKGLTPNWENLDFFNEHKIWHFYLKNANYIIELGSDYSQTKFQEDMFISDVFIVLYVGKIMTLYLSNSIFGDSICRKTKQITFFNSSHKTESSCIFWKYHFGNLTSIDLFWPDIEVKCNKKTSPQLNATAQTDHKTCVTRYPYAYHFWWLRVNLYFTLTFA